MEEILTDQKIKDILKKNEQRYKSAQRMGQVGNWEYDLITERFWGSDEAKRIYGFDPDDETFTTDKVENCIPDRERVHQALMDLIEKETPYDLEFEIHPISGPKRKVIRSLAEIQKDDSGVPYKVLGVIQDITKRKEEESSLKAIGWLLKKSPVFTPVSSQDYSDLTELNTCRIILDTIGKEMLSDIVIGYLELLDTAAAVYEKNGDYAHGIFSSGWCRMMDSASRKLCNTPDDKEALNCGKWLCHESCWTDASKIVIDTGQPVDIECNGGIRLYAVPIIAHEQVIGCINFGYGDPPKDPVTLKTISKKYQVDINDLTREANGYEHRPGFIIEIAKKRVHISAKLIGFMVESKLAQAKLQQEQELLNVTLQSIGDAVITTDIHGKIVLINKVAETLTGWNQKDACGNDLTSVFHIVNDQTQKICENPVIKVLETRKVVELANHTILIARDGIRRVIADSAAPIFDAAGNIIGVVLVFRDMTEKHRLEIALQKAQKMESIGNLAGGIAHDFNNLLYPIIGYAEMLKEDLPKDSPEYESAQEIFNAGKRGGELVKQILAFSRQSDHKLSPVCFQTILTEVFKLIRSTIPSDIEIFQDIQKDCGWVMAEETQLHQIVMNLITNAFHAVEKTGGEISVQLKEIILDDNDLKNSSLRSGQYVMLSVSDNGEGIPQEIIHNIFEPYFTTKEKGKGTGLGLAVVYGILKEHNGDIKVYSEVGKGTTFNVYLPLMKQSDEIISIETVLNKLNGTERILLVDDEESVVRLEKQMLERLGYNISARFSSLEALETFNSDPYGYDLVISDMTMPNMTGDQLARELMSIRPDIPIIICTGFSERLNKEQAKGNSVKGFLMKPVVKSELAQMVRKVLDEANLLKINLTEKQ